MDAFIVAKGISQTFWKENVWFGENLTKKVIWYYTLDTIINVALKKKKKKS